VIGVSLFLSNDCASIEGRSMSQVRDHYKVLGVARDETPGNIRRAFRRLAKAHHPDLAGADGEARFREIAQAHDVLCDPVSRQCHDEELRAEERCSERRPEPPRPTAWPEPEPWAGPCARPWRPGELIRDVDEPPAASREPARGPDLELLLPAALARAGGPVRLALAFEDLCPACLGRALVRPGSGWLLPCRACDGRGTVERHAGLEVVLPAGLRDGDALDLSAPGARRLRVVVRVDRGFG
jgi:hypothetical protein